MFVGTYYSIFLFYSFRLTESSELNVFVGNKAGRKLAENFLKNPGRALEIGAKTGSAVVCKYAEATLSTNPNKNDFLSHW